MNNDNPYRAPEADLQVVNEATAPHSVTASRSIAWIQKGLHIFRQSPVTWIFLSATLFTIQTALTLIPSIWPMINYMLFPIFIAGIMAGCATLDEGGSLTINHLFAGFSKKSGALLGLSLFTLTTAIVTGILFMIALIAIGSLLSTEIEFVTISNLTGNAALLLGLYGIASALLPIILTLFSPALVILAGKGILESLKLSFTGCLKNILPLFVFGTIIVVIILCITIIIPINLGSLVLSLLVMFPVCIAAIYAAYKDIYEA